MAPITTNSSMSPGDDSILLVGCDGGALRVGLQIEKYSKIIQMLLDPNNKFQESLTRTIEFPSITSRELEMVRNYVEYMEYKPADPSQPKPDFRISPEVAVELMLIADFLDM